MLNVPIIMVYSLLFKPATLLTAGKNHLIFAIMFWATMATGLGGVMVHIRRYRSSHDPGLKLLYWTVLGIFLFLYE